MPMNPEGLFPAAIDTQTQQYTKS